MTTRPGCESRSPHPAAGVQSSRAGREAAGGGQAPRAFAPGSHVTSEGPGRTEPVASGHPPRARAEGGAGQVAREAVRVAAPAVPSPATPRPPGSQQSGPTFPGVQRTRGAMGGPMAEAETPERLWLGGEARPEGCLAPPAALGAGTQGSAHRGEPTLRPCRAHLPSERGDAGCDASVPGRRVGTQPGWARDRRSRGRRAVRSRQQHNSDAEAKAIQAKAGILERHS